MPLQKRASPDPLPTLGKEAPSSCRQMDAKEAVLQSLSSFLDFGLGVLIFGLRIGSGFRRGSGVHSRKDEFRRGLPMRGVNIGSIKGYRGLHEGYIGSCNRPPS